MDTVEQALAKVLLGGRGATRRFVGTAFFVDPRHLLTARHCIQQRGADEAVFLDTYAGHGAHLAEIVDSHPDRDIALLLIADPRASPPGYCPGGCRRTQKRWNRAHRSRSGDSRPKSNPPIRAGEPCWRRRPSTT